MFEKVFEKRSGDSNAIDWSKLFPSSNYVSTRSTRDIAYSTCLGVLGCTVGKLNLEIKQDTDRGEETRSNHYLWDMLRLRPNASMSTFNMLYTLIVMCKHYGQAGIYIDRTPIGKILGLYPVRIDGHTIDNAGLINSSKENKILVDFTCIDTQGSCLENDIIIIRDKTLDGINGTSTRLCISDTIKSNIEAIKYQKDLFTNGLTNKAVVQLTSDLKEEKDLRRVQEKFNRIFSEKGRIFTVPAGYSINPLNLNLADSQFAELKLSGKKDVSSAMKVPFPFVDDMKGITENDILAFVTSSISPILIPLEQEMDWKLLSKKDRELGYKIRFNINALLRTTPKMQQEIICAYTKQGIYSLNYAKKLVGAPLLEKDVTVFPSGQVTLEQLIEGKVSYINNGRGGDEGE